MQEWQRQKLSRAAVTVIRNCGFTAPIGGGSGELLGDKVVITMNVTIAQPLTTQKSISNLRSPQRPTKYQILRSKMQSPNHRW
jgi:hypothetical protein